MKKHIKELMHQALDGVISRSGRRELEEALKDPEVREYYEGLKKAEEAIERGFAFAQKFGMGDEEGVPSDEEILEDIRKYGGRKDDNISRMLEEVAERYDAGQARRRIVIWSAAAAAVVVGLVAGWLVLEPGPERLYAKNYIPHEFYVTRSEARMPAEYYAATRAYNEGRYEESAELAGRLLAPEPGNTDYRFLYALSLQGKGDMGAAIEQYRMLLDEADREGIVYGLSAWYLGLCYLKEGEKELALEYLEIAEKEGGMWIDGERVRRLRGRVE